MGLLEKLALHMVGSLPGNGSLLERSAEQTPQNHPDQNAPMHRTGRRGPAPDAGPAWQRLWRLFYPAGARTARDRACAFPANDLSDSPPLWQGGDLNQPPSYIRPSARKFSLGIDRTPIVKGLWQREVMRHGEDSAPALDARSALSQAHRLAISRENTLRIRFLDVRFPW